MFVIASSFDDYFSVGADLSLFHGIGQDRPLATEHAERRLTAILAADVAGYSRLTGMDEEGTHAQLTGHLRSLVAPKIAERRGRVVKNNGPKQPTLGRKRAAALPESLTFRPRDPFNKTVK